MGNGLASTLKSKYTQTSVAIAQNRPSRVRIEAEDAIETLNYFLAPLFGAQISTAVLDFRVRDLAIYLLPNGHAKPEDKPPKIPKAEDLIGYHLVIKQTSDGYAIRKLLERALELVHVLTGDKYQFITRGNLPLRTGDEIIFRGDPVTIINLEKMLASLRYNDGKLQDSGKVLLELALLNTGFSINGYYEGKKSSEPKTTNYKNK